MAIALLIVLSGSCAAGGGSSVELPIAAPMAAEPPLIGSLDGIAQSAEDAEAAEEVREDTHQSTVDADALRRFLEDKVRVKNGLAPKDFVQPELDTYKDSKSPESFVDPTLPRQLEAHVEAVQQAIETVRQQAQQVIQEPVAPVEDLKPTEPAKE